MKNVSILGSTGSIGTQALDVISQHPGDFKVSALSAGSNIDLLEKQIRQYGPSLAAVWDSEKAEELSQRLADMDIKVLSGMEGLIEAVCLPETDIVLTAIVGMIGIRPTYEAINAGKDIALANKETLVTAGSIIMKRAAEMGVKILPVDSEHSAIFQSLQGNEGNPIKRILLTASGGVFRGRTREELKNVSYKDALKNPNWDMGPKVTIDSASMMNKGLEMIEARWLFDLQPEQIQVLVHPQSVVHSAVEYEDRAVIAQLGTPDMRLPIQYALYYPERKPLETKALDLFEVARLDFLEPDRETFKGPDFALRAMKAGGTMPTVMNAANEKAVALFAKDRISFLQIYDIIESCMSAHKPVMDPDLEAIFEAEKWTYDYIESRW